MKNILKESWVTCYGSQNKFFLTVCDGHTTKKWLEDGEGADMKHHVPLNGLPGRT